MNQKYPVKLSDTERSELKQLVFSGTAPARKLRRAQILLKSDSSKDGPNWKYQAICEAFDVSNVTVSNVRRVYIEGGLETVLNRKKPDRIYEHRLDGENEAHLIALVCSETPSGRDCWTLRLLRDRMVQLGYVENISHETIRTTLKKTYLSLG
ncbi:MAG: helix-turn-helix domain-containing protein [Chloroflexi bacterium]|nr:helix-turn-helix domain-containing protein [Chloroflexota bacterium]